VGVQDGVDDELAGHAGDGLLAGGVDGGDDEQVGAGERVGEAAPQVAGARVAVRLEHAHDPPPRPGRGGVERGSDLGGEVVVAVDEGDAGDLAPLLPPPADTREPRERGRHRLQLGTEGQGGDDHGGGVACVVEAGEGHLDAAEGPALVLEREGDAVGPGDHVDHPVRRHR
jgi:hypothetical protein